MRVALEEALPNAHQPSGAENLFLSKGRQQHKYFKRNFSFLFMWSFGSVIKTSSDVKEKWWGWRDTKKVWGDLKTVFSVSRLEDVFLDQQIERRDLQSIVLQSRNRRKNNRVVLIILLLKAKGQVGESYFLVFINNKKSGNLISFGAYLFARAWQRREKGSSEKFIKNIPSGVVSRYSKNRVSSKGVKSEWFRNKQQIVGEPWKHGSSAEGWKREIFNNLRIKSVAQWTSSCVAFQFHLPSTCMSAQ